jgi:hypothetical protein
VVRAGDEAARLVPTASRRVDGDVLAALGGH